MKVATIKGWTHNPGAPRDWTPDMGTCGTLPIRFDSTAFHGAGDSTSAWKPTDKELALLNRGGYVLLSVVGWQVPVAISAVGPEGATDGSLDTADRIG